MAQHKSSTSWNGCQQRRGTFSSAPLEDLAGKRNIRSGSQDTKNQQVLGLIYIVRLHA